MRDAVDNAGEMHDADHRQYRAISKVELTVFPFPRRYW